jgi:hypothetical protein
MPDIRMMIDDDPRPLYICMSSAELHTLYRAFTDAGGHWSTFVIWAKHHFTVGRSDYQRQPADAHGIGDGIGVERRRRRRRRIRLRHPVRRSGGAARGAE